jgi:hypothetical protein
MGITYTQPEVVFVLGVNFGREVFWLGLGQFVLLIQNVKDADPFSFQQLCKREELVTGLECFAHTHNVNDQQIFIIFFFFFL